MTGPLLPLNLSYLRPVPPICGPSFLHLIPNSSHPGMDCSTYGKNTLPPPAQCFCSRFRQSGWVQTVSCCFFSNLLILWSILTDMSLIVFNYMWLHRSNYLGCVIKLLLCVFMCMHKSFTVSLNVFVNVFETHHDMLSLKDHSWPYNSSLTKTRLLQGFLTHLMAYWGMELAQLSWGVKDYL